MRVLHCPTSVGGHPHGLSTAERKSGIASVSVAFQPSAFGHCADECLWKEKKSLFSKEVQRWKLLIRAFWCFDVIHYNFGTPILRWQYNQTTISQKFKPLSLVLSFYVSFCGVIERLLLKHKVIAITYQGDDARQCDYSRQAFKYSIAQEVDSKYYPEDSDQQKRGAIKKFDKMADLIYALNPDLLYVLPARAKFTAYAHIDLNEWKLTPHPQSKIPIVLHAPSHAGAKGTRFILDAVTQLRCEGIAFEFILV